MCTLVTFEGVDSCREPQRHRTGLVARHCLLPRTDQPGPSRIDPHTDPEHFALYYLGHGDVHMIM